MRMFCVGCPSSLPLCCTDSTVLEVVNECQCGVERFDAGNLLYEALYRMRKVFQVMELYFPFIKGTVAERRHPATLANLKSGFLDLCATKSGWILCGGQLPFPESAGVRPAIEAMRFRKGTHRPPDPTATITARIYRCFRSWYTRCVCSCACLHSVWGLIASRMPTSRFGHGRDSRNVFSDKIEPEGTLWTARGL
jgi:hypothetical protein